MLDKYYLWAQPQHKTNILYHPSLPPHQRTFEIASMRSKNTNKSRKAMVVTLSNAITDADVGQMLSMGAKYIPYKRHKSRQFNLWVFWNLPTHQHLIFYTEPGAPILRILVRCYSCDIQQWLKRPPPGIH